MVASIIISPSESFKTFKYYNFFTLDVVREFKILFLQQRSKFPDFVGFGNFPKFKNLSQILFQNPRNWENSQSLTTLLRRR